jgi:hypothetical protein
LWATFSLPPTNHFACGAFDQSSTWVNGVNQSRVLACSAQKPSGSRSAQAARRSRSAADTFALATKSAGGSKRRVSFRTLVMLTDTGEPRRGNGRVVGFGIRRDCRRW